MSWTEPPSLIGTPLKQDHELPEEVINHC
uniref:Uncharacterized protein n=1 Tax=Anguilla anguilla TaxID=7936 RepID=A0A0E9UAU8_ANGAN